MHKLKELFIPHLIGNAIIVFGWYMSIVSIGLDRFTSATLISRGTIVGLALCLFGAYFPEVWIGIRNVVRRKRS